MSHSENVDIFPTLAELAGISVPPVCATIDESTTKPLCAEGRSLAPLITGTAVPREKTAAFWQWTKNMIEKLPVMQYAMAADDGGVHWRYTESVWYNFTKQTGGQGCETCMDWSRNYGNELYNLTGDPGESTNIAGTALAQAGGLQARLSARLRAGWRAA